MSNGNDIRELLTTRRAKVRPARAGLPTLGRERRVSGLRREEVALLAGISVRPVNSARFAFLDPRAGTFYVDSAEPGSPSDEELLVLDNWSSTRARLTAS